MDLNKTLETHERIVGKSLDIFSMVEPSFYDVIVVISSDVVNSIFRITLIIFFKCLPMDLCDGL